jgi:hypothetical protein
LRIALEAHRKNPLIFWNSAGLRSLSGKSVFCLSEGALDIFLVTTGFGWCFMQLTTCRPGSILIPPMRGYRDFYAGNPEGEVLMRILALAILMMGTISAMPSARAQTYDPRYPVCIRITEMFGGERYDCRYDSMEQCAITAGGRPASCMINPYYAGGPGSPAGRERRYRRDY